MKRLRISGYVRKQKNPDTQASEHNRYSNILNREFYAERPMKKIVTDVTYIKPMRKLKRKPPVQYRLEQAA